MCQSPVIDTFLVNQWQFDGNTGGFASLLKVLTTTGSIKLPP
jgi:hypothetical protein